METILIIFIIVSIGIMNILCFLIGARTGQKVVNKEEVKLPNLNPVEAARTYREKKEERIELDNINTMMENIDTYDGTALGQKDLK